MGPIAVAAHLAPFLPGHAVVAPFEVGPTAIGAGRRRALGSASILPISWMYIRHDGRRRPHAARQASPSSTPTTWPAASKPHYPVLYRGPTGLVAHECILDLRA